MSAAAGWLGLTQPAISQAVAALEKSLGFELFDRTARPPVLTLRGKTLLGYTTDVTRSIDKFETALERDLEGPFSLLRIGMLKSFAGAMGPFVISRLRDLATEWSVTASYVSTRLQALIDRQVDFVITSDLRRRVAPRVPAGGRLCAARKNKRHSTAWFFRLEVERRLLPCYPRLRHIKNGGN